MGALAKIRSGILLCAWLLALVPAAGARAELIVVANEYAGTLSIIDGATGAARTLTVGGDPHNLAVTAGGGRVIVTHPSAGQVSVIDPRTPRVLKRFAVPGRPHGVAVSADDRWAFIGAETGRRLYRLDLAKLELAGAFAIEPAPHNLAVTATGRAWITVQGGSTLWLVELASGAPVHRLETSALPHDLALSRQGGGLWVTNWGSPDVFLVQGDPPRLLTVKIGGRQAHHVALTPEGVMSRLDARLIHLAVHRPYVLVLGALCLAQLHHLLLQFHLALTQLSLIISKLLETFAELDVQRPRCAKHSDDGQG